MQVKVKPGATIELNTREIVALEKELLELLFGPVKSGEAIDATAYFAQEKANPYAMELYSLLRRRQLAGKIVAWAESQS